MHLSLKLYYRVLEAMCKAEHRILHGGNLTSLLNNERFHRCMLAFSLRFLAMNTCSPARPNPAGGGETCAEAGIHVFFTKVETNKIIFRMLYLFITGIFSGQCSNINADSTCPDYGYCTGLSSFH